MSRSFHSTRIERRAYTVVELLMAIAIFAIGVSGIIAMQRITIASNRHAKNLAVATQIAESWSDQLVVDGMAWNHPSANVTSSDLASDTIWLSAIATQSNWFRPDFNDARAFGPAFDPLGKNINETSGNLALAHFCTHLRLTWLYPAGTASSNPGNGLIRAEIRVFWLREGGPGPLSGLPVCDASVDPTQVNIDRYHFVHLVTTIKQNTALQ